MSADPTQGNTLTSSNEFSSNKKIKSDNQSSSTTANQTKGTIYITVGPQCSGKTTILKRIFGENFHKNEESQNSTTAIQAGGVDITIDDQALVYIPVPVGYFLHNHTTLSDNVGCISLGMEVLGKTILERINDSSNDELRHVIQRLGGRISPAEFASLLYERQTQDPSNPIVEDLVAAVEDIARSNDTSLPEHVDLFIVEAIFRPRPLDLVRNITGEISSNSSLSALDAALDLLKSHANNSQQHAITAPIAWGNTNTRPREYTSALEAARQSGRPVNFIVFGGSEACDMIRDHMTRREYRQMHNDTSDGQANSTEPINCLPKLTRLELFRRNLQRFLKSGRYIPSAAINDALVRVDSLLAAAAADAKKTCDPDSMLTLDDAKFRLDFELAKLADFELNRDGTVRALPHNVHVTGNRGSQNFNHRAQGRHEIRHERGGYGRGRNYNDNHRGRYNQGGRNGGRQPNFQQNRYDDRRFNVNDNGQGRGWNNYEGRGRIPAGDRSCNSNSTRYNNDNWSQRAGRSNNNNSHWQHRDQSGNSSSRHDTYNRY
jgi:hypothetical protein